MINPANNQDINKCIDFFNGVATEQHDVVIERQGIKSKLSSFLQKFNINEKNNTSKQLENDVAENIIIATNLLKTEPANFKTIYKTAKVINSIKSAIYRLEQKPNKDSSTARILQDMQTAERFLTKFDDTEKPKHIFLNQLFESIDPPIVDEQEKENISAVLDLITEHFGIPNPENMKALALFSKSDEAKEFMGAFLQKFSEVRQENLARLQNGELPVTNAELLADTISKIPEFTDDSDVITDMVNLCIGILGGAMPLNTQINTDGFTIGLFDRTLENNRTLRIENATDRTLNQIKDAAGYSNRSPLVKNRAIWKNVNPPDILTGEKPFISGIRQFDFKLTDGTRRTAQVMLDVSPLGEINFEQSKNVLLFICQMGCGLSDIKLKQLQDQQRNQDFSLNSLEGEAKPTIDKLNEIIGNLGFTDDQVNQLIKISTDFNMEASLKISEAQFSLTPDTKAAIKNQLELLLGNQWGELENFWQQYSDNKEIQDSITKFLNNFDILTSLQTTDKRVTDEGKSDIDNAKKSLIDPLSELFDATADNAQEHINTILKLLSPLYNS